MKSEFMVAIRQLSAEKNLPKEAVLAALESALTSAYKKDSFAPGQDILVRINPNTGEVKVYVRKIVVETPQDERYEVSLVDAQKIQKDVQIGDIVEIESTPRNAGRIAAQIAKQVMLQRLHEAEHHAIYEEFIGKEGDIVTGVVQRIDQGQVHIDLGRVEAILPMGEQIRNERYRVGQRLKLYLLEVARTARGPQLILSRAHRNLLRRLLEIEIPEIHNGVVEIKSVAREAGYRSKVAVAARQEGVDPVGCCVGLRGIRIQNVVNELNGEKIDVVQWHPDPSIFIANALSPAQVLDVELNRAEGAATVVVPDKQLSLAIGKEGQNARLAAKLSGWRIDIKSVSAIEKEKLSLGAEALTTVAPAIPEEKEGTTVAESLAPEPVREGVLEEAPVPVAGSDFVLPSEVLVETPVERGPIRFAEEILPKAVKLEKKGKKKVPIKKERDLEVKGGKLLKARQKREIDLLEEDEFEE